MNENLKKLMKQADYPAPEMALRAQKLAELIVRECANHCDLLLDHKISSEWSRGTHDCSRAIKKHFGVEE